jgi:membrane fusion protein, multidrug efflux system
LLQLNNDELKAQLNKLELQYEIAERNEKRLKNLLVANGISQQEYDNALNQANSLRTDIDYTKAMIRKMEIRAPFDGTIGLRNVSLGAYITNQNTIATLQQVSRLKIDFLMSENQRSLINVGQKILVKTTVGKTYSAAIVAIEPQSIAESGNVKVRAQLLAIDDTIFPGELVTVVLQSNPSAKSLLVPTNTIIPDTRNKKIAQIKNGKIQFTLVETGYRSETTVEIANGLQAGDTIALNGILFLKPDAPVTIKSVR